MIRTTARTLTLQRALLATVGVAILAGMIPAGVALDRRLASALEARARADLALAPRVLADRSAANADAMMMHAKDFAHASGLADAMVRHDLPTTLALVESVRASLGNVAVIVGPDGRSWTGPTIDSGLIAQTRAGKMPVAVRRNGTTIQNVALAPVVRDGRWVGAAGLVAPIDAGAAGVLSGLTRSDVVILNASDRMLAASTLDTLTTREIVDAAAHWPAADDRASGSTRELVAGGQRRLIVAAPLGDAGVVLFTRAVADELAVLPELRRVAFISALAGLLVALTLGAWLATRVARPVRQLADAAAALADGAFDAPLPDSRVREVARVSVTFDIMRQALAARLAELRHANEALVDRNARLTALQADLMQRDRLAATGRLVTQLAHEIRNPVANLRNCLELVRRRVSDDPEAREFTDLAIDELLRMHELAEQMLDLNRPRGTGSNRAQPSVVARDVCRLTALGQPEGWLTLRGDVSDDTWIPLAPDALKQVLVNLLQNAREATADTSDARIEISIAQHAADVVIDVRDNGPGIPDTILARVFDPFFTTKDAVHGVGLGLFVAEGLVRTAGGQLSASNHPAGGAWFRVTLPLVLDAVDASHGASHGASHEAHDRELSL